MATTDRILVERVTDGERCGKECQCKFVNREDEYACILDGKELRQEYIEKTISTIYYRCPSCLATPPHECLTVGQTVERVMRPAHLPLTLTELETVERLAAAANPAPWKIGDGSEGDWRIADFGIVEGADGKARKVLVQTDGCNASRLCGTAVDDAELVTWMRNHIHDLLVMARAAFPGVGEEVSHG